jgi:hypothetical protein
MITTVQRGTPAEEKEHRKNLRERIIGLGMKFMPSDEDIDIREALQREYYALLVLADSEDSLAAEEKKDLRIYSKIFGA